MWIVTVASRKGGSGKTTLTRNLAVAGCGYGETTAVLDTDPQGSLTAWWNRRKRPTPTLVGPSESIPDLLQSLRGGGEGMVFVDTPPSVHRFIGSIIEQSDLVLVPVRPSPDDLAAVNATLALLEGRRWAFVLTQVKARTRLVQEAAKVLASVGTMAPVHVTDRVEYAMSAASGQGVTESEPRGAAAAEMHLLLSFVSRQLRGTVQKGTS
jgi:chromosome partitioning protein